MKGIIKKLREKKFQMTKMENYEDHGEHKEVKSKMNKTKIGYRSRCLLSQIFTIHTKHLKCD